MYRLVGIGADCSIPETCLQAVKRYPGHMNTALVDDYCAWEAKGDGGKVEILCMEALRAGEQAEKLAIVTKCASNDECESGICDDGFCLTNYPYGKFSEDTLAGQRAANVFRAKGSTPLKESGELDAETCAAWSAICDRQYAEMLKDNPMALPLQFVADRAGNALPCFAAGCKKRPMSTAAIGIGIGIGALGILGALIYYRSTQ